MRSFDISPLSQQRQIVVAVVQLLLAGLRAHRAAVKLAGRKQDLCEAGPFDGPIHGGRIEAAEMNAFLRAQTTLVMS